MKKITVKLFIALFSFIFFLTLLEAGLRIAGYFYNKRTISQTDNLILERDNFNKAEKYCKILCIGDSYTVGGNVLWEDTYPSQLQMMLSKNAGRKFKVINGGVCESNSTQALRRLVYLTQIYKPDYVILLTGATNRFNFAGCRLHEREKGNTIFNLRIYKMVRILKTNLKGKLLKWQSKRAIRIKNRKLTGVIQQSSLDMKLTDNYTSQKKVKKTEGIYEKAIESDSDQGLTYIGLGNCCRSQGKFKEAEGMYKKAIELTAGPELTCSAYIELGTCYRLQGKFKEAEGMYKEAIELSPDKQITYSAYIDLGNCYREQKMFRELQSMTREATEYNSDQNLGYINAGSYYQKKGKFEEAENVFKKAIELDSESSQGYIELGQCYQLQRRYSEAEALYRKGIELDPVQIRGYIELGSFYMQQGKFNEAEKIYKKAIELNFNREWKMARIYFFLARLYMQQGKYDSALEYFCKALDGESNIFFATSYQVVKAYELQSKYDSDYVLNYFQKILEAKPELKERGLQDYILFFKDKEKAEKRIYSWLKKDLENIVKLCQANDIKLIIQNYPYPFSSANKCLKNIAMKYFLPFIDNALVFNELSNCNEFWRECFDDEYHCTAEGYRIMADNVYRVLISEGIVSK